MRKFIVTLQKILIIGGGAGGIELATRLGRKLGRKNKAEVTLVDKSDMYFWKPLLHELAAGAIDPNIESLNYLAHGKRNGFEFQQGCLKGLDRENKTVLLDALFDNEGQLVLPERQLDYDILVLAVGSISNDFSIPGIKENCFYLDNSQQAKTFHNKAFELFFRFSNQPHDSNAKINVAIVGAGATGVELSAELHSTVNILSNKYGYKALNNNALNLVLIEAGDRILPALPEKVSKAVDKELSDLNVTILNNTKVVRAEPNKFITSEGKEICADLMVWAAGIKVCDTMKELSGLETTRSNQFVVKPTLQVSRDENIFALGDCAYCQTEAGVAPPRAQVAHQMATLCSKNIIAKLNHAPLKDFKFFDKGTLISLSHYTAVGSLLTAIFKNSIKMQGSFVQLMYKSLYRTHQIVIHGYVRTSLLILVSNINRILRPKVKLN